MNRFPSPFGWVLLALCAAGILASWILNDIPWYSLELGVFALLTLWSVSWLVSGAPWKLHVTLLPLTLIVLWGLLQLVAGTTVYRFPTETEVLRWLTYLAIFFLGLQLFQGNEAQARFVRVFTYGSFGLALLSILQYFSSNGRVFWLFATDSRPKLGPFLSYDHYCSFIALGLAMALDQAVRLPRRRALFIAAAGIMYASAVAGTSRAGVLLLTIEIPAVLLLSGLRHAVPLARLLRVTGLVLLACAIFVLGVGWETLYGRYVHEMGNYRFRVDAALGAIEMFKAHPFTGFGLGTWLYVHPQFAHTGFEGPMINAAHNDWLQWSGDGGLPMVACMLVIFGLTVRSVIRFPWSAGAIIPFLHALVDFPFHTRFIPAVLFLVMGVAAWRPKPDTSGR